jgi:hypothetical protein
MSIIYPGFFMPAAIAIRTKCFTIFGGNAGPQVHIDPVMGLQNFGWIAPEPFCQCFNNHHECKKDIPEEKIIAAFEELRSRPLVKKKIKVGSAPGLGDTYWFAAKAQSFKEKEGIDELIISVHEDPLHSYTGDWLSMLPFIDKVDRVPGHYYFPFVMLGGPGTPLIKNTQGCDYIMEFGSRLSEGDRLEEILPKYEPNYNFPINLPAEAKKWAADYKKENGGKLYLFFTASIGGNKAWNRECWTVDNWIELGEKILAKTGIHPVIIGATWDETYAAAIAKRDLKGVVRQGLVGKVSIAQHIALIKEASFLAGFTCGTPMISTYFGIPTVHFWPIRGVSAYEYYKPCFMTSWVPRKEL